MGGGSSKSPQKEESSTSKKRREGKKTSKTGATKDNEKTVITVNSHGYTASQIEYIETVFASMPHSNAKKFNDLMKILKVEKHSRGETIVDEDEEGSKLYIVAEGQLEASAEGTFLRSIDEGNHFGELSVLHHLPYGIRVIVKSPEAKLFVAHSADLQNLQGEIIHDSVYRLSSYFSQMPELEMFPVEKLSCLAGHVLTETYSAGEKIRVEGERSDKIFVIEEGDACIELGNEIVLQFNERHVHTQTLNMRESMSAKNSDQQVITNSELNWKDLDKFLGIIRAQDEEWTEEEKQHYKEYQRYDLDEAKNPTKCYLKVGCILGDKILRGKAGGNLNGWVWHDCHVHEVSKKKKKKKDKSDEGSSVNISIEKVPSSFRESFHAGFLEHSGADYPYTVTAVSNVKISYFTIDTFERLFGSVNLALKGDFHSIDPISVQKDRHLFFETTGFDNLKKVCDMKFGCMLKGEYTIMEDTKQKESHHSKKKIYGVSNSDSPIEKHHSYVLRIMGKTKIVEDNQLQALKHEMDILNTLDSPYIVTLSGTFQTHNELMYVFDAINDTGKGDLWHLLYDSKCFDMSSLPFKPKEGVSGLPFNLIQHYGACLIDALGYMFSKQIIYRNLKAENIMLDKEGQIKLVGFGNAKILPYKTEVRRKLLGNSSKDIYVSKTMTYCGTPEYMAPEIVMQQGHDRMVDLWALGVVIHEMMFCRTPFASDHHHIEHHESSKAKVVDDEEKNILDAIKEAATSKEVKIKGYVTEHGDNAKDDYYLVAIDLLEELLVIDPTKRLGSGFSGPIEVLSHEFFAEIDAVKISKGFMQPPYKLKENGKQQPQNMLGFPKMEKFQGDQQLFDVFSDCLQKHDHKHYSSDGSSKFKTIK